MPQACYPSSVPLSYTHSPGWFTDKVDNLDLVLQDDDKVLLHDELSRSTNQKNPLPVE
jgi:hypothetical protein